MKVYSGIFIPAVALLVFLLSANQAAACSCIGERPPCEAFGEAKAVFVGKVIGAKEQREIKDADGTITKYDVGEIYFKLEEAFVGVSGTRVVIHSGTGGGDCGYWFKRGERYLVYAYGDSVKNLSTYICTRTRLLENADEDLAFLRNLPRKGVGARIYGAVETTSGNEDKATPLTGITIKIEGKRRTYDAVTDVKGEYEVTGIEPGEYKVHAVLPEYYYSDEYSTHEVKVNDRGCAGIGFYARNDSGISGQVVQPDGSGLAKANVELIPVSSPDTMSPHVTDETWADENGKYELSQVPPGRYLLGINITSSPSKEQPYARTFYPGVTERSQATVIEVGLGQKLPDINIQLLPSLTVHTVRGLVVWPDGTPAVGTGVNLEDVNRPGWCVNGCQEKTNSRGQFALQGFDGYTYKVQASTDKPGSGTAQPVHAEAPTIKLTADVAGIRLVLSLPGHSWDEEDSEKEKKKEKEKESP